MSEIRALFTRLREKAAEQAEAARGSSQEQQPAARPTSGRATTAAEGEELETVQKRVKGYIAENRNQNTSRTYASGWAGFQRYMEAKGWQLQQITGFHIADYLRERVEKQRVAASTVAGDRAAIADALKHTPQRAAVEHKVVGEILAVLKTQAAPSRPKQHMSAELMAEMIAAHGARGSERSWLEERNICLLLLMMLGFLRESEAAALKMEDAVVKEESVRGERVQVLQLAIVRSKTDQGKNGAIVLLGENKQEASQCPVSRLRAYLQAREKAGVKSEFLFPTKTGTQMSSSTPCGIVQRAVQAANERAAVCGLGKSRWGEPMEYGSHSMRRGGVTAARANGVSMLDIQRHGRWKSLTVFAYVGNSAEEQLAVTDALLGGGGREAKGAAEGAKQSSEQEAAAVKADELRAAGRSAAPEEERTTRQGSKKKRKRLKEDSEEEEENGDMERMEDELFAEQLNQGYESECRQRKEDEKKEVSKEGKKEKKKAGTAAKKRRKQGR